MILNTVGGDVEAGLALAELVAGISKPTVVWPVIGGGHSIGIPLAVSADYTFAAKSATMTLHPIRTSGTLITAEPTFAYMKKTQGRVVDFIVEHSSRVARGYRSKNELYGQYGERCRYPAVRTGGCRHWGLIDEIGSLVERLSGNYVQ